jgi:hypothetical protein
VLQDLAVEMLGGVWIVIVEKECVSLIEPVFYLVGH